MRSKEPMARVDRPIRRSVKAIVPRPTDRLMPSPDDSWLEASEWGEEPQKKIAA